MRRIFWLAMGITVGIIGLGLSEAAYMAEIARAGILSVDRGQREAAEALGMDSSKTMRRIVLPQAFRSVINPLASVLIALIKNTTIASVIGVAEASLLMKSTIESYAGDLYVIFAVIALGFVILTLPVGLLLGKVSEKVAVKR